MSTDRIVTIVLSAFALGFSIYNFYRSRTVAMYQDLDRLYLELLKLGIANPGFVNPSLTRDYKKNFEGDKRLQYELYAFMVWNVCETIHDRRDIKGFFRTWECIIKVENDLHRDWFDSEENRCRFKDEFNAYVNKLPKQRRAQSTGQLVNP